MARPVRVLASTTKLRLTCASPCSCPECDAPYSERASLPPTQRGAVDERLKAIAFKMADSVAPRLPRPAATWDRRSTVVTGDSGARLSLRYR